MGAPMLVSEAMNRSVVTVEPDVSVDEAVALARRAGVEHLLVVDQETLVGILCTCDLGEAGSGDHVSDRMSVPVLTVRPDVPVEEAAETMGECAVGCLPVAVGGLVLGTLSEAELERCGLHLPGGRRRPHCARGRNRLH